MAHHPIDSPILKSWLRKGRRRLRRIINPHHQARRRKRAASKPTTNNNRLVLDLRDGIGYALTRLNLLSQEVDHLILRQSAFPVPGLSSVDEDDLSSVFQEIANLSHLTTFAISDFDEQVALPVSCLVILLLQSLELSALRLDTVRLTGSRADFGLLATVLEHHPSLEEICFSGCLAANENNASDSANDGDAAQSFVQSIATAISKIPTLTTVEIVETSFPPSGIWTGESLSDLCRSRSLRSLRVRGIRFLGDQDISLIATALQCNTTLKELWLLSCELGYDGCGPEAVAQMLRVNSSLEILGLNRLAINEHAIVIAEALKTNRSLRTLHLCLRDGGVTSQIYDSYAKLMEQNYVLEKMSGGLVGTNDAEEAQIDFYLRLNRNGRRFLLQNDNSTREDWIDALCLQSDDVSALFYLISRNPSLCCAE